MSFLPKPKLHHPELAANELGYTRRDYEGAISTLCAGCGHDSISAAIVRACFELSLPPHRIAKLSGIGCSSKTPTYFLGAAHGFNSVHGRMPSVATGAYLANRDLIYLGVSGDGDSASIGLGQFAHGLRRGVNMTYIVENNGVYGLLVLAVPFVAHEPVWAVAAGSLAGLAFNYTATRRVVFS